MQESENELLLSLQTQYRAFVMKETNDFEMDFINSLHSILDQNKTKLMLTRMKEIIKTHLLLSPSQLLQKYKHIPEEQKDNNENDRKSSLPDFEQKVREYPTPTHYLFSFSSVVY
jgi:hypothetical protein